MKKQYIQPNVQVTNISLSSALLAVSGGGGSGMPQIHMGVDTDDQW